MRGDGTYTFTEWFRTTTATVSDIATVATVHHMSAGPAPATHHLIVAGHRRRIVHLVGAMWDTGQLGALADDFHRRGVPVVNLPQPITMPQLRSLDRRFAPSSQARPVLAGLLFALGTLLLFGGLVALVVVALI